MISLLDVKLLLSLAWTNHAHHNAAHDWFARESPSGWATCLLTQIGFLRLSLNPQVVGTQIDCQSAIGVLSGMTTHPAHRFVDLVPATTAAPFDELIARINHYQQITDAALLHMARFHAMKLVTFDQGISAPCPWPGNLEVIVP